MTVEHGGTDAGPTPRVDASTNANPYGPSPMARAAMAVDIGPYPDPEAAATRVALARHHGLDPLEVVIGAGATELIDRLVRVVGGPVIGEEVTFGEYAGAAARHGTSYEAVPRHGLPGALRGAALAFACSPGNPDGEIRDAAWSGAVATAAADSGTVLVWDLAYAPLVPDDVPVPHGTVALHAPNKAHGCTGLRAGWLQAPRALAARLRTAGVTWSVSAPGLAFLRATATAAADDWVAERRRQLLADRDALAAALRARSLEVVHGDAPFLLVRAPEGWSSRGLAAALRTDHGIKVRPTDSMGRPGWLRIAAVPPSARDALVTALTATLGHADPHLPSTKSRDREPSTVTVAADGPRSGARSAT